ncbi:MAG: carbohydrate kinase family protein [Chloroflexi bacterium]|nr:MAG: carbohydrate kinase family protein [Chloroflexota bacterium]
MTDTRREVTVIGDMNVDVSLAIDAWPHEGGDVLAHAVTWSSGGTGLNCAVAIARLGFPVRLWSRVGRDPAADQVLNTARDAGVDIGAVQHDTAHATGLCIIPVTPGGERTFLSARGANVQWHAPALPTDGPGWLHVCGHALLADPQRAQAINALRRAHAAGWQTSLDLCDPLAPLLIPILAQIDAPLTVLMGNEREVAAVPQALGSFAQMIVTKRGARGATVSIGAERFAHPGYVVDAIDTTACGDTFGGVFCSALFHGASVVDALAVANAAGALTASRRGAADIEPTRREICRFLIDQQHNLPLWLTQ